MKNSGILNKVSRKGVSAKKRKQTVRYYAKTAKEKSSQLSASLTKELKTKLNTKVRSLRIRVGDVVLISVGDNRGKKGKVLDVDTKKGRISIEGITNKTAKGTQKPAFIKACNVRIVDGDFKNRL